MKQMTMIALLWGGLLSSQGLQAADVSAALSLKGRLVVPASCVLLMGSTNVRFGDVLSTRIDGFNYRRMPVPYTLVCNKTPDSVLKMTLKGDAATFTGSNGALSTSINDLGILFYNRNAPIALNNALSFSYTNQPELYAVPIAATGVTLTSGGYFMATVTLIIDYN